MSVKVYTDYFTEELVQRSHAVYAAKMSAYMKDKFVFYGVQAPARKDLVARLWKTEKSQIKALIRPLSKTLWKKGQREYQMIALDLIGRSKTELTKDDLPFLEQLITTKSWWDTVDFLAATNVGTVLKRDKVLAQTKARAYMASDNMWLQRTALIFQLKYKDTIDEELLFELILKTLGSREFFINKASGWALRQYSKYNPESVRDFIDNNRGQLAPLTVREGTKYL